MSETNSIVLHAKNLGVSFISGHRTDDYKSFFLSRNRNPVQRKQFWPIRDLNLVGYQGEILGIIGSNGSGKTTLCKVISGILQPDEGSLQVNGNVKALYSLGLGFNKELTGRENIYTNGMLLGIRKQDISKYIKDIHEFSGIGSFIDKPVKHYSSGMKARLGFSIVSFMEPEILILDEALNTGDLEFSRKAAIKMKELVKKAKLVILVTHSISYAVKNCDRLIWLDKGRIRAEGDPKTIAEMYKATVPTNLRKNKVKRGLDLEKTQTVIKDNIVIDVKDLTVTYRNRNENFDALRGVNFQIREGEVVGIIGHNGAGKSTLCKVMTRILSPSQGEIRIKGETTALLGYGTGFNSQLSGKDNVYLNGMLLGIPKSFIRQKYPDIVKFSGLENFIEHPVKQYSSGMRSRLGFSIAAMLEPDIFIIDEALSTGDMAFNIKASERIQEMIERAKAVVIVTHSLGFVEKVCTRAIMLKNGKIEFDGDPNSAVAYYKQDIALKMKKGS